MTRTRTALTLEASGAVLRRLGRAEGQVRGISSMVEEGRYRIDVLQQITAAQAALDTIALELAEEHSRRCIFGGDPEDREALQAELMTAIGRLVGRR